VKQTVRVHTLEGATFEGVLADDGPRYVVLEIAKRMKDDGAAVDLGGRQYIPRERVHLIQVGWS
jgi:hypothetical protein